MAAAELPPAEGTCGCTVVTGTELEHEVMTYFLFAS